MLKYWDLDPGKAYRQGNLLLPLSNPVVSPLAFKNLLTFNVGLEDKLDPDTGEKLGVKQLRKQYEWDQTDHHFIVPRHFLWGQEHLLGVPIVDCAPEYEKLNLDHRITLRPAQSGAFAAMCEHRSGTVNLACGKGKTVLALYYAVERQMPTIIIVNQQALIHQWMDEIRRHIGDIPVGVIQGKNSDWRDKGIVLATVQTLALKRRELEASFADRFGVVFFDEGHHMSAPLFVQVADLFLGDRFSLTATAKRGDGLEHIYQYHLGPIIYQDLTQDLIPHTTFVQNIWTVPESDRDQIEDVNGQPNHGKLCGYLGRQGWRNEDIAARVQNDVDAGRTVLVLTHSRDHAEELHKLIPNSGLVTGKHTKAKDRIPVLKNYNPVVGTFQLAREALDKKSLDSLHICTPFSSQNDLQQAVGRIQRAYDDKQDPVVTIYEDPKTKMSYNQCRRLRTYLRALGYPFEEIKNAK